MWVLLCVLSVIHIFHLSVIPGYCDRIHPNSYDIDIITKPDGRNLYPECQATDDKKDTLDPFRCTRLNGGTGTWIDTGSRFFRSYVDLGDSMLWIGFQ
jgi:hypothetical protein